MASAFGHALAAFALGKAFTARQVWYFWVLGLVCAVLPDADVIAFKFGIPYESMWGHRGFTHSFAFAAMLAVVVVLLFFRHEKPFRMRWWGLWAYFFLATSSHAILDAMTTGGLGVAFFSPWDNSRYFFPWRPIQVSPIGVGNFFSEWGLRVIKSEAIWIGIPCLAFMVLGIAVRLVRKKKRTT
ncbi:MAG: metal-dependent hydrolase [Bacteroidota bacterium]